MQLASFCIVYSSVLADERRNYRKPLVPYAFERPRVAIAVEKFWFLRRYGYFGEKKNISMRFIENDQILLTKLSVEKGRSFSWTPKVELRLRSFATF